MKLLPMNLEKYYELSDFCTLAPTTTTTTDFAVSDSYKSKFSLVMLKLFRLNVLPVGDLAFLAILSECLFGTKINSTFHSDVLPVAVD
jgi:hypothetical protein